MLRRPEDRTLSAFYFWLHKLNDQKVLFRTVNGDLRYSRLRIHNLVLFCALRIDEIHSIDHQEISKKNMYSFFSLSSMDFLNFTSVCASPSRDDLECSNRHAFFLLSLLLDCRKLDYCENYNASFPAAGSEMERWPTAKILEYWLSIYPDNQMVRTFCSDDVYAVPRGELTDEHLNCAKRRLSYFGLVLLMERMEESMEVCSCVNASVLAVQFSFLCAVVDFF